MHGAMNEGIMEDLMQGMMAYPISNGIAVDGVVDQVQAGPVVQSQGPEGLRWQRKGKGEGVELAPQSQCWSGSR